MTDGPTYSASRPLAQKSVSGVSDTNAPHVPSGRFGTFEGVFTPCVLTILGVIMFMRVGFVAGYAGLWMCLLILALSKLITTLTTLSLSAIATNLDVRVGGVYFMISRVLGPDFGGSIGITLFIAQAVSVAFYTIGFTEATFATLATVMSSDQLATLHAAYIPELVSSVVILGLFVLTFKGADVALKAQYVVLAVLVLSVVSFLVGGALNFDAVTFRQNQASTFTQDVGFWTAFAIFFPAATGISAGANMSGDLKNPARSIPRGTLIAIAVTFVVYAAQVVVLEGSVPGRELRADPFGALQEMSVFAPLIVMGVFAATLSSALGSFLGAPRILQAMGQDRLMKPLVFFGKGAGPANEPRRATTLTFVIASAVIWAGDLNAVAQVISMFFLIAYGMINLSAFVESKSANPSFRPRFKLFHWSTGLLGAVGCGVAMVKIDETYALIAGGVVGMLYFYLRKRDIQANWGDAKRGYIFQRTRDSLLYLESAKIHPKNWRPILAAISPDPLADHQLIQVGSWLESQRGLYTIAQIDENTQRSISERVNFRHTQTLEIQKPLKAQGIVAFVDVTTVQNYLEGFATYLQCSSIGGLRPNSVLLSIPHESDQTQRARFLATVDTASAFDLNLALLKPGSLALNKPRRIIHLWWRGETNGSLMALFAYLTTRGRTWHHSQIHIFRREPNPEAVDRAKAQLERLLEQSRIEATICVLQTQQPALELIPQHSSAEADLVMLGLSNDDMENFPSILASLDPMLKRLPTTLLVHSNGEADVFA